jgi:DNA-binding ferritin-like protein
MERVEKLANLYVASLRAIYLVETHCHWRVRGLGFFGTHLLFERLYKQSAEDSDAAAEKFIGLFGDNALDFKTQQEYITKLLIKYQDDAMEELQLALNIERDFVAFAKQTYDELDKADVLTLGLDDLIMSQSSNAEGRIYLLQQALERE